MTYNVVAPRGAERESAISYYVDAVHSAACTFRGRVDASTVDDTLSACLAAVLPSVPRADANVTALLDSTRRGESETYTTPAPSWYVSTVSDRKVSRGKKGTQTTITYRGRVAVVGDSAAHDDQTTRNGNVPRVVISHAIDELRGHSRFGHVDGDKLAALTTRLYDVPALIGSDHWSWSEATPEIPSSGSAVLAAQTCGLSGGAVPMLDAAVGPEYRTADGDTRWYPTGYARKHHLRTHSTRLRLPVPRKRKSDALPLEHVVLASPWRAWMHVQECIAPTADSARVFHGHRVVTRGETVKRNRATVIRESFIIAREADIAHVLPNIAATVVDDGKAKYGWRVDGTDIAGVLTIDARKRMSVTGLAEPVRQCVTVDALRKRIATLN